MELTEFLCPVNYATGSIGTLISNTMTSLLSMMIVAK